MPDYNAHEFLPSDFHTAARPEVPVIQPPKVMMSVALDADVVAFLSRDSKPSNVQQVINGVMRHDMETSMRAAVDFDAFMATVPAEGPGS